MAPMSGHMGHTDGVVGHWLMSWLRWGKEAGAGSIGRRRR
jgi:hypothetical protein